MPLNFSQKLDLKDPNLRTNNNPHDVNNPSIKAKDVSPQDESLLRKHLISTLQKSNVELPPAIKSIEASSKQQLDTNGKFDLSSFGYYFSKGVYNNVTSIFSFAYNNPVTTIGLLGAGAAACLAFPVIVPTLLTTLTVMGFAVGGLKIAQGINSILKAKNGDEVEKAAEQLGDGATTIGLALLSRPAAVKIKFEPNFNPDMIAKIAQPALYLKLFSNIKQAYKMASDISEFAEYLFSPKKSEKA